MSDENKDIRLAPQANIIGIAMTHKGAVVKIAAVDKKMMKHEGPARVFNTEYDAMDVPIDVWLHYFHSPQWTGALLCSLGYFQYCNAILYLRMGESFHSSPCKTSPSKTNPFEGANCAWKK